jgi:DNA polymerase III alpha subunit
MGYADLHCHSYYSFHYGAPCLEELLLRSKDLGYRALAITDRNNLCGAVPEVQAGLLSARTPADQNGFKLASASLSQ